MSRVFSPPAQLQGGEVLNVNHCEKLMMSVLQGLSSERVPGVTCESVQRLE